jgi:hypothetical protein
MGAWGLEPWDNDGAADFFGELWEGTPIVDRVIAALDGEDSEAALAALWLCSEICRNYVWPIQRLAETIEHAIAAANRLLAGEDDEGLLELYDDETATARVVQCRDALLSRER